MDDATIKLLEIGNDEDAYKILREFNAKNVQTFNFPGLNAGERRKRVWAAVYLRLKWACSASGGNYKFQLACLESIRILSRDKEGLNEVVSHDLLGIMLKASMLTLSEEDAFKQSNFDNATVIIEAQKSLCNLIFNCTVAQVVCCKNGSIEGIVVRLKTYKNPELPHEVKFYDMRMLFLLTALCAEIRPKLRDDLHGLTYLMEVLDLILKTSAEREQCETGRRPADNGLSGLDNEEVDLACEILKILFNLTVHVDRSSMDEEDSGHFMRLVSILHDILICKVQSRERAEELHSHTVNLLTNMPGPCYEELLTPVLENILKGASGGEDVGGSVDGAMYEYDGQNVEAIVALVKFLEIRLDRPTRSMKEALSPVLTFFCEAARSNRTIRKFLRARLLPPRRDVYSRPEQGEALRNKLCRLLTSPITDVKDLVADFLFVLCKESVARLIKYTGYGNAAGLLASRGLMFGGQSGNSANYSSDSEDSETEEYREVKDMINPVIGCYEEPRPDPMAGMSDEQKEFEAMQLVNLMDKLSRDGMVQPCRIDEEGRPRPIEHILELQDDINRNGP